MFIVDIDSSGLPRGIYFGRIRYRLDGRRGTRHHGSGLLRQPQGRRRRGTEPVPDRRGGGSAQVAVLAGARVVLTRRKLSSAMPPPPPIGTSDLARLLPSRATSVLRIDGRAAMSSNAIVGPYG